MKHSKLFQPAFAVALIAVAVSAVLVANYFILAWTEPDLEPPQGGIGNAVPPGAVMAFNLLTCPTGWSQANGVDGRPDLRGRFIRGLNTFDNNTTCENRDTERGCGDPSLLLGEDQADAFAAHTHQVYQQSIVSQSGTGAGGTIGGASNPVNTQPSGSGGDTRPKNVALIYCVKD